MLLEHRRDGPQDKTITRKVFEDTDYNLTCHCGRLTIVAVSTLMVRDPNLYQRSHPRRWKTKITIQFLIGLYGPGLSLTRPGALACIPSTTDALQYMRAEARTNMPSAEQISSDMVVLDAEWMAQRHRAAFAYSRTS
ncbi:hypothetical protein O7A70_31770 [Mesorhizobium sp. Cs1299R1N1]|uniref:hypothetical protein n=1 Tax=Mesorhizobium sp. Cs1299R1N1 TaxID=3015172 RepID=UPI00301BD6B4